MTERLLSSRNSAQLQRTRWRLVTCSLVLLTLGTFPLEASGTVQNAGVGVGAQYTSTHVYLDPEDLDAFTKSFLATFGGQSTKQVVATVTPTPSQTTTQLLKTQAGLISLFGYKTPVPWPFGKERTGYLVTDIQAAARLAVEAGADVIVAPFDDPIGKDMVIEWPGGVDMQLYWHTVPTVYDPLLQLPEDRIYLSSVRIVDFLRSYLAFSGGRIVFDNAASSGIEVGMPDTTYRRIGIESVFGKVVVLVTNGHLPFPYGRETTGYEVSNLETAIARATASGARVLDGPYKSSGRQAAIVQFPGGYIAELHTAGN